MGGVLEVQDKGIRSIPVARQVRLFYRIADDALIILEFIDTRTERFQVSRDRHLAQWCATEECDPHGHIVARAA